jgi:type IV pilus biogenesis protein CpaD/CtpE
MRKTILTTLALVALCSPVFAQNNSPVKDMLAQLEVQRAQLCKKTDQTCQTEFDTARMRIAILEITAMTIAFKQVGGDLTEAEDNRQLREAVARVEAQVNELLRKYK